MSYNTHKLLFSHMEIIDTLWNNTLTLSSINSTEQDYHFYLVQAYKCWHNRCQFKSLWFPATNAKQGRFA